MQRFLAPLYWILALIPLGLMLTGLFSAPEPVDFLLRHSGQYALQGLLLSLCITPMRQLTTWRALHPARRIFGLAGFAYAALHFSVYLVFDLELRFDVLTEEVIERPYIAVGAAALGLLVPLALTSTRSMMRRLGRRWQILHRLAYVAPVLAVLHFLWLVKADLSEPLLYAAALAVLLGWRVVGWSRRRLS